MSRFPQPPVRVVLPFLSPATEESSALDDRRSKSSANTTAETTIAVMSGCFFTITHMVFQEDSSALTIAGLLGRIAPSRWRLSNYGTDYIDFNSCSLD